MAKPPFTTTEKAAHWRRQAERYRKTAEGCTNETAKQHWLKKAAEAEVQADN